ncbi:MAG: UDP-3-O-(3-hydroxymyristoyl)glucosamine N-acyltransferase [Bryobacteraceae bacterium]
MRVRDLAVLLNASYEGDGEVEIRAASAIESAGPSDLAFIGNRKAAGLARTSHAGCIIVPLDFPDRGDLTTIPAREPRAAFARAVAHLHPARPLEAGIHSTAVIADDADIHSSCFVGPHVHIAGGVRIGPNCSIGAGSSIGASSVLGSDCVLHPGVAVYHDVEIGSRVVLHSGCIIGADGFGFVRIDGRYEKFPQIGRVRIEDDCEIGANTCIDRAALGVTRIGEGTKLDNLVHIGHNCDIGRHVVIAAQTGLSGGVIIEDNAVIGGQVGIGDKARIQSGAVLGSGCGILTSKIVRGGQVVWGTPARPLKEHLQQLASLARLPKLAEEVETLKRRLAKLESP